MSLIIISIALIIGLIRYEELSKKAEFYAFLKDFSHEIKQNRVKSMLPLYVLFADKYYEKYTFKHNFEHNKELYEYLLHKKCDEKYLKALNAYESSDGSLIDDAENELCRIIDNLSEGADKDLKEKGLVSVAVFPLITVIAVLLLI